MKPECALGAVSSIEGLKPRLCPPPARDALPSELPTQAKKDGLSGFVALLFEGNNTLIAALSGDDRDHFAGDSVDLDFVLFLVGGAHIDRPVNGVVVGLEADKKNLASANGCECDLLCLGLGDVFCLHAVSIDVLLDLQDRGVAGVYEYVVLKSRLSDSDVPDLEALPMVALCLDYGAAADCGQGCLFGLLLGDEAGQWAQGLRDDLKDRAGVRIDPDFKFVGCAADVDGPDNLVEFFFFVGEGDGAATDGV
jgi:hypothetical protein